MGAELKHRWSLFHNYLAGITAGTWWRLLRDNKFQVDFAYWHRAAFISAMSLANSLWARKERRKYADAVEATELAGAPLFILGHWRSGTTLLHELMARDAGRFGYANTYQAVNPETFLTTEEKNTRRFGRFLPDQRPMDNMKLSFGSPQEDEFAPCLSTLLSSYVGISFPRRQIHYDRYITFEGAPEEERNNWKGSMLSFAKKLTYKTGRPLLYKSPPHTGRIRLLLELFPDARFVHIHRNPFEVYQSTHHFFDAAAWFTYLQEPDVKAIPDGIIRRYSVLMDAYLDERKIIPDGRLVEVAFTDLERDPVGEVRKIYDGLALGGFGDFEPTLKAYVDSLKGYRKNRFPELDPEMKGRLAGAWGRCFNEWGYSDR